MYRLLLPCFTAFHAPCVYLFVLCSRSIVCSPRVFPVPTEAIGFVLYRLLRLGPCVDRCFAFRRESETTTIIAQCDLHSQHEHSQNWWHASTCFRLFALVLWLLFVRVRACWISALWQLLVQLKNSISAFVGKHKFWSAAICFGSSWMCCCGHASHFQYSCQAMPCWLSALLQFL